MLLVTGATGTTGMEVLRALKDRGVAARALVRDETKAHHLRDLGFEPVTGDLGDPRTLGPVLEGVERAYLVSPTGPMQSELEQAFIESAKEAGVRHIVKLSVIGASPEAPLRFARSHGRVEEALKEDFQRELGRVGVPPWNAEGLAELFGLYADGGAAMVTTGVMDALGRDPRDLDAFAADHVEAFKAAGAETGGDRP